MTGGHEAGGILAATGGDGVGGILAAVAAGRLGADPAGLRVSTGFVTRQAVRHAGRRAGYRNEVVSLRVGTGTGSCAVESAGEGAGDGAVDGAGGLAGESAVYDAVGATVAELLAHPSPVLRIAAADAYLADQQPHERAVRTGRATRRTVAAGGSLDKSLARAAAVVDLVPPGAGPVLVVGVVNSLLGRLRERGRAYLPCDLRPGRTEWDEPHLPDALAAAADCDALLVSGMTAGNGTLDPLVAHAREHGKPLVVFAQTASAVLPQLVGHGVTAVCAEPYPFFWLSGDATTSYVYDGRRPA